MLLQLACALVVAIFFFGDPRVRSSYDVFGLALLAARVADRFGLEESRGKLAEKGPGPSPTSARRGPRTPPG
jgi:hypothetical protein